MIFNNDLAVVILAAGKSSRMQGFAKQLLEYKNESLLKIAAKKALNISKNVYVVLGNEKERCEKEIENLNIEVVYNSNYELGIGSSISAGVTYASKFRNILIMLCDQPFIPLEHLKKLEKTHDFKNITASFYAGTCSVPAIFPSKYYDELISLNGNKGAKTVIGKHGFKLVELDKAFSVDIDTPDDAKKYLNI